MPSPDPEADFEPLAGQINIAARATRGLLDAVLAQAGTTFSSWTVLAALSARGPAIQKDLAASLKMIGPSIVERIDQLEAAGLVTRSPVPGDRRAALVGLTGEGRELITRLRDVMRATEDALTSDLSPDDVLVTRRVLARVAERARTLRAERAGQASTPHGSSTWSSGKSAGSPPPGSAGGR